jgi:hypothetical protein
VSLSVTAAASKGFPEVLSPSPSELHAKINNCVGPSRLNDWEELAMGKCLKGESEVKKKDAKFECGKCGARAEKKSHVCKPEKLKGDKKK